MGERELNENEEKRRGKRGEVPSKETALSRTRMHAINIRCV